MIESIHEQIASLLTGERKSLSVHEQWEYAQSLKKLNAVYEAAKDYEKVRLSERTNYGYQKWMALRDAIAAVQTQHPEREQIPAEGDK